MSDNCASLVYALHATTFTAFVQYEDEHFTRMRPAAESLRALLCLVRSPVGDGVIGWVTVVQSIKFDDML